MKHKHAVLSASSAIAGAITAAGLLCWPDNSGYQLYWLLLMAVVSFGHFCFIQMKDRRAQCCFGVLGVLFVFAIGLGLRLEALDETGWDGLFLCFALGALWGPAAGWLFFRLASWLAALRPASPAKRKAFLWIWGLLLLCWLPVIIAYYPGITGYDMDAQIYQIMSGDWHAHHPLLHTLFLAVFYKTLGPSLGYGVHTVLQAILLAASIAYALAWLRRIRCPKGIWLVLLGFFALSPQHAILAVSGTKDTLFAAVMLVIAVEWCRLLIEPQRAGKPAVLAFDILMMALAGMLRNNAVYGMAAVWAVTLLFRRSVGKQVLALLLAGMVAAFGSTKLLNAAFDAHPTSTREMMSVPCQQLGRVYYKYGTSVPVGYEIPELLPDAPNYAPERADYTKRSAKVMTNGWLIRFVKLWGREAFHYPIEYIDAFLLNSKGFWYPGDYSFAITYDRNEGPKTGCLVLKHAPQTRIDAPWMLPGLREWFNRLFALNEYRAFTPGWMLLHPAVYTWLMCFLMAWAAWRRQTSSLISLGIMAGYLLTLFLGPCAIIRYQYYLMLAAPVIMGVLCVQTHGTEAKA